MRKTTKKARMRPAKARSGGDRIEQLETNLKRLEGLAQKVFEEVAARQETSGLWRSEKVTPSVTVHRWQPAGGEAPGSQIAAAVEKKLNGHGLSLKDAAPPTMTTPTRRTVMERLAELETTDELLDAQHREFALEARAEIERLMERLRKLEAALGEV